MTMTSLAIRVISRPFTDLHASGRDGTVQERAGLHSVAVVVSNGQHFIENGDTESCSIP